MVVKNMFLLVEIIMNGYCFFGYEWLKKELKLVGYG